MRCWDSARTAPAAHEHDTVRVRPDVTLEVVMRYMRMRGERPSTPTRLFVVNRHDKYLGGLDITRLLTEDPERPSVNSCRASKASRRKAGARSGQAVRRSRPGVGAGRRGDGKLLGRITVDDVVDVIREEADHSVMSMAGLTKTRTCSPACARRPGAA